jgi:hypothetical protein
MSLKVIARVDGTQSGSRSKNAPKDNNFSSSEQHRTYWTEEHLNTMGYRGKCSRSF